MLEVRKLFDCSKLAMSSAGRDAWFLVGGVLNWLGASGPLPMAPRRQSCSGSGATAGVLSLMRLVHAERWLEIIITGVVSGYQMKSISSEMACWQYKVAADIH